MFGLLFALASAASVTPVRHDHLDTIRLVSWQPSDVICAGAVVAPLRMEIPATVVVRSVDPAPMAQPIYHFRIDVFGRPLSIRPESPLADDGPVSSDDFEPALAGSRFPTAQSRTECTVHYMPRQSPIRTASIGQLAAVPPDGDLTFDEFTEALRRPGDTCATRPAPRNVTYPPIDTLPDISGHVGRVLVRFDVDANGATTGVELLYNNGTAELASMVLQATRESRFAPAARHGCVAGFRVPVRQPLAPPPAPSHDLFLDPKHRCPSNASQLVHVEDVPFPEPFRRRNIEGWAEMRFDIAADGTIENLETVRAEPAAAFGEQAKIVLIAGHGDPTPNGYVGCVTRIRFKLDDSEPAGVTGGKPDTIGH